MEKLSGLLGMGGWDSSQHPVLHTLIEELRPERIIEVGVWLGASVWWMAKKVNELKLDTEIIAIDTWLGSPEFGAKPALAASVAKSYDTFLANMFSSQAYKYVTVLRQTSCNAAIMLRAKDIRAEMIHIDAGHQEWQVTRDLDDYVPLLAPGGVIVGDDFDWVSVRAAVEAFVARNAGWRVENHARKFVLRRL